MTQDIPPPPLQHPSPLWGLATLLVAFAWLLATHHTSDFVNRINATRAMAALMTGQFSRPDSQPESPMHSIAPGLFPGLTPPPPATDVPMVSLDPAVLRRQIAWTEAIVRLWRRGMEVVAGLLLLAGALGLYRPRWSRGLHLAAAAIILLATMATLAVLRLLMNPGYGGLEPLSLWTHLGVAATASLYAWVLLIAFARRRPLSRSSSRPDVV